MKWRYSGYCRRFEGPFVVGHVLVETDAGTHVFPAAVTRFREARAAIDQQYAAGSQGWREDPMPAWVREGVGRANVPAGGSG